MSRARSAVVVVVLLGLFLVLPGQAAPTAGRSAAADGDTYTPPAPGSSSPAALKLLARAAESGSRIGYSGTQVVVAWHDGGSTSRLVVVSQAAGGARTATVQDTVGGAADAAGLPGAGLSALADRALTERTLTALTGSYVLALGGKGRIAGRAATVVTASRDGRVAARMWLDHDTGLLLRQDVLAADGVKLRRTTAFIDVEVGSGATGSRPVADAQPGWNEVPLGDLAGWRDRGWPAAQGLADGFQLLDARTGTLTGGAEVLHLTYGDGLSAISVFLQRGRLDTSELAGWNEEDWGDSTVRVRTGWPEMITWQGGQTVITALGDVESGELEDALARLPRDPAPSPMDSVARFARNSFSWLPG